MFSCEFCEIFKNIFLAEHLKVATSGFCYKIHENGCNQMNIYVLVSTNVTASQVRLLDRQKKTAPCPSPVTFDNGAPTYNLKRKWEFLKIFLAISYKFSSERRM